MRTRREAENHIKMLETKRKCYYHRGWRKIGNPKKRVLLKGKSYKEVRENEVEGKGDTRPWHSMTYLGCAGDRKFKSARTT